MSQEQALQILVAWRQQLTKENTIPVLRLTKKNKTLTTSHKSKGFSQVYSSRLSVCSDDTEGSTSTKLSYQSEKLPLDDLLLIKKVFGNGLGVPCNKRTQHMPRQLGSVKESGPGSLGPGSVASTQQTTSYRGSTCRTFATRENEYFIG